MVTKPDLKPKLVTSLNNLLIKIDLYYYIYYFILIINMTELSHQDWKPVTLNRTYTSPEKLKNAQRTGETTSVNKNTLHNKSTKLDSETENFNIVKSGLTLGREIQQGRTAKKLTQKQLATMLNEKPQVIQQYENGQAIPNPQIINKLQKSLGVKLTRPKNNKVIL